MSGWYHQVVYLLSRGEENKIFSQLSKQDIHNSNSAKLHSYLYRIYLVPKGELSGRTKNKSQRAVKLCRPNNVEGIRMGGGGNIRLVEVIIYFSWKGEKVNWVYWSNTYFFSVFMKYFLFFMLLSLLGGSLQIGNRSSCYKILFVFSPKVLI